MIQMMQCLYIYSSAFSFLHKQIGSLCGLKCCKCFIYPLQNGYIDGPIVNTFRTNLVVLPTVLEYLQYILIGLGLATIIVAAVVYHKVKVKLPHRIQASMLSCLTARCILLLCFFCLFFFFPTPMKEKEWGKHALKMLSLSFRIKICKLVNK